MRFMLLSVVLTEGKMLTHIYLVKKIKFLDFNSSDYANFLLIKKRLEIKIMLFF